MLAADGLGFPKECFEDSCFHSLAHTEQLEHKSMP